MYRNVEGALEPDMEVELTINGDVADVSDATAHVALWHKPDGTVIERALVPGTGGLAAGRLRFEWVAGETDDVGSHYAQAVITRANGEEQVFPSDGTYFHWKIAARLS